MGMKRNPGNTWAMASGRGTDQIHHQVKDVEISLKSRVYRVVVVGNFIVTLLF